MLVEGCLILMLGTKMVLTPQMRRSNPLRSEMLGAEVLGGP